MSEKFNDSVWRKVRDAVILCVPFIPVALISVVFVVFAILATAVVSGTIFSLCWNTAITKMFGVQTITWFKAFMLTFTIGCLRADYKKEVKSEYAEYKEKIFNKSKKENMSKVIAAILAVLLLLVSILVAVWATMYSWNTILPQLLNLELVQINFKEAFGFAYLFHLFFGISRSASKKLKKEKKNEEVEDEAEDDDLI